MKANGDRASLALAEVICLRQSLKHHVREEVMLSCFFCSICVHTYLQVLSQHKVRKATLGTQVRKSTTSMTST